MGRVLTHHSYPGFGMAGRCPAIPKPGVPERIELASTVSILSGTFQTSAEVNNRKFSMRLDIKTYSNPLKY